MELTGKIKTIFETQTVSDKFKKREVIITTEANTPYTQYILCQLTQDKTSLLDSMSEGDEVKAQYNLRGRLWNGPQGEKCFVTVELWKIERIGESAKQNPNTPTFTSDPNEVQDLPF